MEYTKKEENQAIKDLKRLEEVIKNNIPNNKNIKAIKIVLNLLEKQQKEIERLYKDNYRLDRENQLKFERAVDTSDYVSKDKIREKIKEIEERIEEENEMLELNQICKEDYESRFKYLNYALNIYKRLLGDE